MTQIFTAKTVEDAKALAARTFGIEENEIHFEILEEPKRGLFGRLKGEAKVKAAYEIPAQDGILKEILEEESTAESLEEVVEEVTESEVTENTDTVEDIEIIENTGNPESREESAPAVSETVPEFTEEMTETIPEEHPEVTEEIAEAIPETLSTVVENPVEIPPEESIQEVTQEEVSETVPETNPDNSGDSGSIMELISGEASEESLMKIERAKNYLASILSAMNIQATLQVKAGAESVLINIETRNSGAVIGKHGDTLDALQYLTFMSANQGAKEYYRIILDTANYRERRRKTLEELAAKIAANVLRTDRPRTLEPMNPYERRIIHSVIADIVGVISRSVGEEPYRKIMILPENHSERPARRNASDRHSHHGHSRNSRQNPARSSGSGYRSRSRSDRRDEMPSSRISMDSMKTDFEKGYRRPRPEDELNTGLYGKLNFD